MKPCDFKPSFSKDNPQIQIEDRVWYIPKRHIPLAKIEMQNWSAIFNNERPVIIEYCSGNGEWIAAKAEAHPLINWVAVEYKFERVRKIWSKMKNRGLENLLIVCGEAHYATENFFPSNTIADIYINFPDPWPKTRHFKNRLIQHDFTEQMWRILQTKGIVTFVTDDIPYFEWTNEIILKHGGFAKGFPNPTYIADEGCYGTSYFDQLWRSKGLSIQTERFGKIET